MFIYRSKNPKLSQCLADHREDVVNCFGKFTEFFRVLFSARPDRNTLQSLKIKIDNCESAADCELRHVMDLLGESFLPTTRTHLLSLIRGTDEVADRCQEIVRQVLLERTDVPLALRADLQEIIAITKRQLSLLYNAIDKLIYDYRELSRSRDILDDIRAEESRVDHIQASLHERIFALRIPLAERVYYRDMTEQICALSDLIAELSDRIRILLVAREA